MSNGTERVPKYLSKKLKVLSFLAIAAVVLAHSYNYADHFLQPMTRITEGMHIQAMVEYFFANAITRFSVPTFFMISGYLFFSGVKEFTLPDYISKIKKRIISIMVPYVFWVLFWTFISLLIVNFFSDKNFPLLQEHLEGWADNPFTRMFVKSPVAFQFWFLKDLMKLVLLSPIYYLLIKKFKEYTLLLFLFPWLIDISFSVFPATDGMLFFGVGTYLALYGQEILHIERPVTKKMALLIPALWIAACAGYTFLCAFPGAALIPDMILTIIYKVCMALGVIAVSILYDFFAGKEKDEGDSVVLDSTFLIFLIHEPIQHFIFQYVFLRERSGAVHLILFFGLPLLMILISILISMLLSCFAPRLRYFLTGGR